MNIQPIKTHQDHIAALSLVDKLRDAQPGTPEFDALDRVVTLIESYKAETYPIEPPAPAAARQYEREKRGLLPADQGNGSALSTEQ